MSDMFKYMSMYMSGLLLSNPTHTRQQLTHQLSNHLQLLDAKAIDNIRFALYSQDNLNDKTEPSFFDTDNVELKTLFTAVDNSETNRSSNLLEQGFYDTFDSDKNGFETRFNDYLLRQKNPSDSTESSSLTDSATYAISRLQNADFSSDIYDPSAVIANLSSMVDANKDKAKILSLLQNQRINQQQQQIIANNLPAGEVKNQYQDAVAKLNQPKGNEVQTEPQNRRLRL